MKRQVNHFKAAMAIFAMVQAALAAPTHADRARMFGKIPTLRHRGHGRGLLEPQHNRQAMRSRYMPHQGERERERRRIGGFHTLRRPALAW